MLSKDWGIRKVSSRRRKHENTRSAALFTALVLSGVGMGAQAQTVIFSEPFAAGTGSFTPTGTVNGGGTGASMHGRLQGYSFVTSPPINTTGRTNLSLSWTQMCLNSDGTENCMAFYSTNNITWTPIYATVFAAVNSPVTIALPAAASNQSQLRVRFQRNANSFEEVYDVDNVILTAAGGGGGGSTIPDPTVALLEATNGPLAIDTYVVPNPSGYGGGTVTYPTAAGSYPGVVLMPGWQGNQGNLAWLAPRLASWGFVVINVDTLTLNDDPNSRGTQISAAGTQLINLSAASSNPISGKVNGTLGVAGHSMGGGGAMVALRDDNRFAAAAPLAPYHPSGNFGSVTKPAFFLVCASDSVASGNTYAKPWYNSMTGAEKLYISVPGGHECPMTNSGNKAKQGKYLVSWFSRWLKSDPRFTPFLCTDSIRNVDRMNSSIITEWLDTCPY